MNGINKTVSMLFGTRLFENIPEKTVFELAQVVKKEVVPANATVFCQGDPGDSFYLISSGKVRVFRKSERGVETDLSFLGPGEYFGEMALLTDQPRSAYVETLEKSQFLVIAKDQFHQVVKKDPDISLSFFKQVSNWLIRDETKIEKEAERQSSAPKISYLDYVVVIGVSLLFGIIFNLVNPNKIDLIPAVWSGEEISHVVPSTAIEKFKKDKAILIDARPSAFYDKAHLKGAKNLPFPLFDLMYMMNFGHIDKSKDIIVYGRDISSLFDLQVARKLILRGHKNTTLLKGGLSAWKKQGYSVSYDTNRVDS